MASERRSSARSRRGDSQAVAEVPGVTGQEIEVVGYVGADELNALLKEEG